MLQNDALLLVGSRKYTTQLHGMHYDALQKYRGQGLLEPSQATLSIFKDFLGLQLTV